MKSSGIPAATPSKCLCPVESKMPKQKKVCVVGSGNWGTAIARIIGYNAMHHNTIHDIVTMYVYEEMIDGKKLTDIINEKHENVKYLPGYRIPSNVIAIPDLVNAAKDADIIIFVIPHQFVRSICATLLGKIKPTAHGLSLIKGFDRADGGGIELISNVIARILRINVSVLMGANLAHEVAAEQFTEATVGCQNKHIGPLWYDLLGGDNFKVSVTDDAAAVEVYSGMKNVVALGAGIIDGLGYGDNTKAAVIRVGLMEMIKFVDAFYPGAKLTTFFESCGVADLIASCYGGRNRRIGEMFTKTGKSIQELETEVLNGQKAQGPLTAEEVNYMLKSRDMEQLFPMITAIHRICKNELQPCHMIDVMKNYPETSLELHNTSF